MIESIAERTANSDLDSQKYFQLKEAFQLGCEGFPGKCYSILRKQGKQSSGELLKQVARMGLGVLSPEPLSDPLRDLKNDSVPLLIPHVLADSNF